jgi:hypothetical protein
VIAYATAQSSSVYLKFSVIDQIIDLNEPAYVGGRRKPTMDGGWEWVDMKSWDTAFKLKVRRLKHQAHEPDRLTFGTRWNSNTGNHEPITDLDDIKLTTINKVERVIKVEGMFLDG